MAQHSNNAVAMFTLALAVQLWSVRPASACSWPSDQAYVIGGDRIARGIDLLVGMRCPFDCPAQVMLEVHDDRGHGVPGTVERMLDADGELTRFLRFHPDTPLMPGNYDVLTDLGQGDGGLATFSTVAVGRAASETPLFRVHLALDAHQLEVGRTFPCSGACGTVERGTRLAEAPVVRVSEVDVLEPEDRASHLYRAVLFADGTRAEAGPWHDTELEWEAQWEVFRAAPEHADADELCVELEAWSMRDGGMSLAQRECIPNNLRARPERPASFDPFCASGEPEAQERYRLSYCEDNAASCPAGAVAGCADFFIQCAEFIVAAGDASEDDASGDDPPSAQVTDGAAGHGPIDGSGALVQLDGPTDTAADASGPRASDASDTGGSFEPACTAITSPGRSRPSAALWLAPMFLLAMRRQRRPSAVPSPPASHRFSRRHSHGTGGGAEG